MIRRRIISVLLSISIIFSVIPMSNLQVNAGSLGWTISGTDSWTQAYPTNDQNDYLQDQQTGSGSVSQDIVGNSTHQSVFKYFSDTEIAFRIRVSNINGGTDSSNYEFKNFAFIGIDADNNGSVDFFLGAYNPSGSNGRLGIYSASSGCANISPSTTGISGKPLMAFQPERGVNYSITQATDGSNFNGDADYFISFKFSVADITAALVGTGYSSFSKSTPFRFITGTAAQDNSFNQDISGMDKSGWKSGRTWNSLGVFSTIVSADGTANYYTVLFDKNTGDTEASPSVNTVSANSTLGTLPTRPTKRGMYFQEWNTKADGTGTKVTASTVITENTTVYAIWSDKVVYTVTFDPNGGNFGGSTSAVTVDTIKGIVEDNMPSNPTYTNKYFMGWNTASNGSGTYFNSATSVSSNITLYADWSQNANKVAAFYNNFDSNGGSEVVRIYSNGNSNNFNGSLPTITRTGYTFGGWFLNDKTCAGTPVTSISSQGSYYAKWTPASYTLTFNGNGTSVVGVPSSYSISNGLFGTMPTEPTRSGYQFIEWNKSADGTGEAMYPSTVISSNVTVYAIWKASKTITFDTNGGNVEGSMAAQTITETDGILAYQPQPPARDNYTFWGWGTTPDATSVVSIQDVSSYNTLYAVWSPVYQVTFDVSGGSWDGSNTSDKVVGTAYGSVLYIPTVPVRTGYTFNGWVSEQDGIESDFVLNSSVSSNITVYARWVSTSSTHEVTFHENGGSSVASLNTASIATMPSSTRTGYTLNGWYTDSTCSDSSKVTFPYVVSTDVDLFAKWDAINYDLSYDLAGGNLSVANPNSYNIETASFTLNNPTRNGYTFAGWTGTDLTEEVMSVTVNTGFTGNRSYTANWNANNYSVKYDANSGTYSDNSTFKNVNQTYNSNYVNPSEMPTRSGYTFASWNTQANGGGDTISPANTAVITSSQTLYAIWTGLANVAINYSSNNTDYGTVSNATESINPEIGTASGATAIAKTGYHFVKWQDGSGNQISANALLIPQKGENGRFAAATYTAVFAPNTNTAYTVEHYIMGTEGTYPSAPTIIESLTGTTGESLTLSNLKNSSVLVAGGISYNYGKVDGSSATTASISPDGSLVVKLYYTRSLYTLTLAAGTGISSTIGGGTYYYGQSVNINANVNAGYVWEGWKSNNIAVISNQIDKQTAFTMPNGVVTLTAQVKEEVLEKDHGVKGDVIDDAIPANVVEGATIVVMKGTTQYGNTTTTDSNGSFAIYNIPAGAYNLIMTSGDKTEIIAITVKSNVPVTNLGTVVFPLGNASSRLLLKGKNTPAVVVGNLHPEAEILFAEQGINSFVKVEMTVARTDEQTAIENGDQNTLNAIHLIDKLADETGASIGIYLDMLIDKYQRISETLPWSYTGNIKETNGLIQILVPIPEELQGKSTYVIYRFHDNSVNVISNTPNVYGEYLSLDTDSWTLTLNVKKFSVYALAYYTETTKIEKAPNTGDKSFGSAYMIIALTSSVTLWFMVRKKKVIKEIN